MYPHESDGMDADGRRQEPDSGLVRPYFRTGGRTRPTRDLPIEALVVSTGRGRNSASVAGAELRAICRICEVACSVAEVGAYLGVPLGVVRVLIGDAMDRDLVTVHTATLSEDNRPSMDLLYKVLDGLQRI